MKSPELTSDYHLVFTSGTERFALPASCVQEILYPHEVTPLPFVPAYIDGLINIEGTIAIQISFARLNNIIAANSKELVLIDTGRALCALAVDTVIGRIVLETNNTDNDNDNITQVDPQYIGQLIQAGTVPQAGEGILGKINEQDNFEEDMYIPCLVVSANQERYAFELSGIIEVIEAGNCTPIPGAADYLKGFHLVRDQALLVIDLLAMIGQPISILEKGWIIIVEREDFRYGFFVNVIEGIVHFPLDSYEPITENESNLSGLFVYQEQTTVLLSPKRIVHDDVFDILSRHTTLHTQDEVAKQEEQERYLQVTICEASYAIPITSVKRITQMFPMEDINDVQGNIRGAINMNGSIIPVLDMERALNLQSFFEQSEYVIVGNNQQEWAICVDTAHGMVSVPSSHIKRMANSNSGFVNGVARIDEQLVPLLDFSIMENLR